MLSKLRLLILLVIAIAIVFTAFVGVTVWQQAQPLTATLPDGSVIHVLGVLRSNQPFTTDKPLYKIARKFLPRSLRSWIPSSTSTGGSGDTNAIAVYLTRVNAAGSKLGPFWETIEAIDDDGFVYRNSTGSCSYGANELLEFTLRAFPRRQHTFTMRLYGSQNTLMAQLNVPNPFVVSAPAEWKPEALPIRKTNGTVAVTLRAISIPTNTSSSSYELYPHFVTEITSTDPLWQKYGRQHHHWLTDSTGNSTAHGGTGVLSPREKAWKVHLQAIRNETTPFPTNEVWRIENLTMPKDGEFTLLNLSNRVESVGLSLMAVSGAATLTVMNETNFAASPFKRDFPNQKYSSSSRSFANTNWTIRGSDCPFVLIETRDQGDATDVLFRFADEDGKKIKPEPEPYGYESSKGKRVYIKRLKLAPGQKITLEIIVNRGLEFEFLVDPKEVKDIETLLRTSR